MTLEELQSLYLEEQQKNIKLTEDLKTANDLIETKTKEYEEYSTKTKEEVDSLRLYNQKLFLKLTDTAKVFEDKEEKEEPANFDELAEVFL